MEKTRNTLIREAIEQEQSPMLTAELLSAHQALAVYVDRQKDLGQAMSGAMSESSETFHDNAPAEAIANDSTINTIQATKIKSKLASAVEFDLPNSDEDVSLGSIVTLAFGSSDTGSEFMVTGITTDLEDHHHEHFGTDTTIEAVTINSPLGQAIFDKKVGDTVTYSAGARDIRVKIIALR